MAIAAPASPASALESRCISTYVCLFQNGNYDGYWARYSGNDDTYTNNSFDSCAFINCGLNDSVSSIDNDGVTYGTRHYVNYYGASPNSNFYIARGGYKASLTATYDDDLTAHRWG
ncbi:hypothetical protein KSP35_13995 [Aquihabitans sp. G128]|uniref:hypothetical protein n=1 Tax=Aquihabitans sp. G128 TaxID=2849779 RepID=UPI001C24D108|nr:hypothetical protein [Aquihabitans sp. G128]QXC59503.1 hypothetical protein KSP35_13995 [Aquihabitans sp. G128]